MFTKRFKNKLSNLKHGSVEVKHRNNIATNQDSDNSSYMENNGNIEPLRYIKNNGVQTKSAVPQVLKSKLQ